MADELVMIEKIIADLREEERIFKEKEKERKERELESWRRKAREKDKKEEDQRERENKTIGPKMGNIFIYK